MDDKLEDLYRRRKQAYQDVFQSDSPAVKIVLADLSRFCRGETTAFHTDPRVHAALEGRREVYWRIKEHIDLPVEEFLERKGKKNDYASSRNDD